MGKAPQAKPPPAPPKPPKGQVLLTDNSGTYLLDKNGAYITVPERPRRR